MTPKSFTIPTTLDPGVRIVKHLNLAHTKQEIAKVKTTKLPKLPSNIDIFTNFHILISDIRKAFTSQ
jgi:endonuclease III-like uncharacterized protein